MRQVKLEVGNKTIGEALTWAYPEGKAHGIFLIPTYNLNVSGVDSTGNAASRDFEVFRFGIHCPTKKSSPAVVGLAEAQTHVIKAWLPHYSVHSAVSTEMGAWQVYGNFLIHDGPDDKLKEIYASIGCVEICNGPSGFVAFNDFLIELAGPSESDRDKQLAQIGKGKVLTIKYLKATRPPLKKNTT